MSLVCLCPIRVRFVIVNEQKLTSKGLQAPVANSDPAVSRHRRADAGRRSNVVDVHTMPLTILDPRPVQRKCFYANLHCVSLRALQRRVRKTTGID